MNLAKNLFGQPKTTSTKPPPPANPKSTEPATQKKTVETTELI